MPNPQFITVNNRKIPLSVASGGTRTRNFDSGTGKRLDGITRGLARDFYDILDTREDSSAYPGMYSDYKSKVARVKRLIGKEKGSRLVATAEEMARKRMKSNM